MWRTAALRRGACTRDFRPTIPRSNASTASATVVVPAAGEGSARAVERECGGIGVDVSDIRDAHLGTKVFHFQAQRVAQRFDAYARSTERSAERVLRRAVGRGDHQGVTIFVTDVGTRCAQGVVRAHEVDFDCATHVFDVSAEDRRIRLDA